MISNRLHTVPHVSQKEWDDWRWQMRNRLLTVDDLPIAGSLTEEEKTNILNASHVFPMAISPYYASLIDWNNHSCPIKMQCVPHRDELEVTDVDMRDPLQEDARSPVGGIVHRYPDRVLLLMNHTCAVYCRHCTRKRMIGDMRTANATDNLRECLRYIEEHGNIRDVLLSGGDPLLMDDDQLEDVIQKVKKIDHIEIIRIGTRVPVVLPQRITVALTTMLKKYHPLWLNTHFNHPDEFTPESTSALARLADAGIPLGNQTVLLRGINDCPFIIKKLMHLLLMNRVRPYYLYHCDRSRGISHFRTTIERGMHIMNQLNGHTTGLAVPSYVIDLAGGGGKTPLLPKYWRIEDDDRIVFMNFQGEEFIHTEFGATASSYVKCAGCKLACNEGMHTKRKIETNRA